MGKQKKEITVHRSGKLKQKNKPFKPGKHASKSSLKTKSKGRVPASSQSAPSGAAAPTRQQRRARGRQLRANKHLSLASAPPRLVGTPHGPPRLVVIVPLSDSADPCDLLHALLSLCPSAPSRAQVAVGRHFVRVFPRFPARLQLFAAPRDPLALLDAFKVADLVLFHAHAARCPEGVAEGDFDFRLIGDDALKAISLAKAQGLPATLTALTGLEGIVKQRVRASCRAWLARFARDALPTGDRVVADAETDTGLWQLVRFLGETPVRDPAWRHGRAHVLAHDVGYDAVRGGLLIEGYVRGAALCASDLVHVPDVGDIGVGEIRSAKDPFPFFRGERGGEDVGHVLSVPEVEKTQRLPVEREPDALEGEQNVEISDEDGPWDLEEERRRERRRVKRLMKEGASDIQATWLDGVEDDEDEDDEDEEDEEDEEEKKEEAVSNHDGKMDEDEEEDEEDEDDQDMNEGMDLEDRRRRLSDDVHFPDEFVMSPSVHARTRFARYRGLESFRDSTWDEFESLPREYARIYRFRHFHRLQQEARAFRASERFLGDAQTVSPGACVALFMPMPRESAEFAVRRWPRSPLVLSVLFAHEHQKSVLHCAVTRCDDDNKGRVVRGKDEVLVSLGFRRVVARPVYSEHAPQLDKHRVERFLHAGRPAMASFYGPVCYSPTPALLFAVEKGVVQWGQVLAQGQVAQVDPMRVMLKRVVLTGVPFRVQKARATVRGMFFHPEDVEWFKPLRLTTKFGLSGHIKESLGTHGLFKARFDGILTNQDTVLMTLYKRVFPRWNTTKHLLEKEKEGNLEEKK